MPLKVVIYSINGHTRSGRCAQAMKEGVRKVGDIPIMRFAEDHRGAAEYDACIFYGFTRELQRIMRDYRAANKPAVYIDLGYWGRQKNDGHHKVVVNARHPTEYFQRIAHDDKRSRFFNINLQPWRRDGDGDHILLAGMGSKASVVAEGIPHESFERTTIKELRKHTSRPIVYRPKPSCKASGAINGTVFSPPSQPIEDVLRNCHAIVTHHSNAAVDALIAGIPAFAWEGVAAPMGLQDCGRIETPVFPEDRQQWINDIAYTQWTWTEMAQGLAWRHLKDEGIIP